MKIVAGILKLKNCILCEAHIAYQAGDMNLARWKVSYLDDVYQNQTLQEQVDLFVETVIREQEEQVAKELIKEEREFVIWYLPGRV